MKRWSTGQAGSGPRTRATATAALAAALLLNLVVGPIIGVAVPSARAQTAEPSAPAPVSTAPAPRAPSTSTGSFRLEPGDGRTPGVAGPANDGIPPLGPQDRAGPPTVQRAPVPRPSPQSAAPQRTATVAPQTQGGAAPARAAGTAQTATPVTERSSNSGTRETPERADGNRTPDGRDAGPATDRGTVPSSSDAASSLPSSPSDVLLAPAEDVAAIAPETESTPAGGPGSALWIAALLAVIGGGAFWLWQRRRVAPVAHADARDAAAVMPAPAPMPPAAAPPPVREASPPAALTAPPRAAAPTITARSVPAPPPARPAAPPAAPAFLQTQPPAAPPPATMSRARLELGLEVTNLRTSLAQLSTDFAITLTNRGPLPAESVLIRLALHAGSAEQEAMLTRFYDGLGGGNWRELEAVGAGETVRLAGNAALPLAGLSPLMVGDKPLLIPVLALDITYHWDGPGDAFGQVARAFVLGQEPAQPDMAAKLGPVRLDWGPRRYHPAGARATALERTA